MSRLSEEEVPDDDAIAEPRRHASRSAPGGKAPRHEDELVLRACEANVLLRSVREERLLRPQSFAGMRMPVGLPVAVIGAGPVGLAAAAHLLAKGETPLVLEAGASAGASVLKWGHVRIFSPWRHNVDTASAALLEASGWVRPPDGDYPTGQELVERYLAPLAALPAHRPPPAPAHARAGREPAGPRSNEDGGPRARRPSSCASRPTASSRRSWPAQSSTRPAPTSRRTRWAATAFPPSARPRVADRVFYGIPDVLGPGPPPLRRTPGPRRRQRPLRLQRAARPGRPSPRTEPGTRIAWAIRRAATSMGCSAAATRTSSRSAAAWAAACATWPSAAC